MLANRIFLMICVIAGFLLPNPCPAEGDGDRLKSEAQALFKVIVGDKAKFYGATSARCRVSIEWLGRDQGVFPGLAIPEDLAREFLGAQFYGEVVAPDVSAVPKEVLDPNSEHSRAFCSPEERQAYETEEEDLTDSGNPAGQWGVWSAFSFPVFDDKYETAIVVDFRRTFIKARRRWDSFLLCQATAYRKNNGKWQSIKSEEICIS